MKIALLTLGSRGDVQPYIALAKALYARGHDVRLAAPENFADWIAGHGVPFAPIEVDLQQMLQSPDTKKIMAGNWFAIAKIWRSTIIPAIEASLNATWRIARDADVILYHPKIVGAVDVAETTGAIAIGASPIPMMPTGAFPLILWPRNLGRLLNRLSYVLLSTSRLPYLRIINRWRRDSLGLPKGPVLTPIRARLNDGELAPALCAVSPTIVPRPADWADGIYMDGYWFLDETEDWTPDPALARFLKAGSPPIYIGFGSMTTRDPQALARIVIDAVARAGIRAILATGWGGLDKTAPDSELPASIHLIESAPHEALFEHVSAVVHHGGAGTTAAGLRAGLPTLVCPLAVDQPFWGRRVWKLGCGPKPQSLRRLNVDRFSEGLSDLVHTERYRAAAKAIAAAIQAEKGIDAAIAVIEAAAKRQQRT